MPISGVSDNTLSILSSSVFGSGLWSPSCPRKNLPEKRSSATYIMKYIATSNDFPRLAGCCRCWSSSSVVRSLNVLLLSWRLEARDPWISGAPLSHGKSGSSSEGILVALIYNALHRKVDLRTYLHSLKDGSGGRNEVVACSDKVHVIVTCHVNVLRSDGRDYAYLGNLCFSVNSVTRNETDTLLPNQTRVVENTQLRPSSIHDFPVVWTCCGANNARPVSARTEREAIPTFQQPPS